MKALFVAAYRAIPCRDLLTASIIASTGLALTNSSTLSASTDASASAYPFTGKAAMLHAVGLVNLTVAGPVYQMLGSSRDFLISHRITPGDLALFIFALSILFPLVFGLFWAIILRGLPLRAKPIASGVIVAAFSTLYAQSTLNLEPALRMFGWGTTLLALVLGSVGGAIYAKAPPVRTILSIISVLTLLLPLAFVARVRDVFSAVPSTESASPVIALTGAPPIIMIVFDEFPVLSLLDARGDIDATRYPNFARLASRSDWYRYAKTGSSFTLEAVPSILNGQNAERESLPTLAEYPDNLFALLAPSYDHYVSEYTTYLYHPPDENDNAADDESTGYFESAAARLKLFCSDLSIAYGHRALPSILSSRLPGVNNRWGNFAAPGPRAADDPSKWWLYSRMDWARKFISSISPQTKPKLYFLHTPLPHFPWHYTPSGKSFEKSVGNNEKGFRVRAVWKSSQPMVDHYYHRHLLQVGFVDRLIGELIDHLESVGLYDDSLLIITGDHGIAFRGMENSRRFSAENLAEILFVPLFIKLPGQSEGRVSDSPAELIDILPTIASTIGLPLQDSWQGFPISASSNFQRPNVKASYRFGKYFNTTFAKALENLDVQLIRKIEMLSLDDERSTPYWFGPLLPLMGRPLDEIPNPKRRLLIRLESSDLYNSVDPASPFIPSIISGAIPDPPADLDVTRCVIVANGIIQAPAKVVMEDGAILFYAILPDEAFVAGRNNIELLEFGPSPSAILDSQM